MKLRTLFWFLPVFLFACNKGQNNAVPITDTTFSFTTTYDSMITVYPTCDYSIIYYVKVLAGDIGSNRVDFGITGLPPSIVSTPPNQSVGYVLGGVFTLTFTNAPLGADTANFSISSVKTGTQNHKLYINVIPYPDVSPELPGAYNGSLDYCLPDTLINYISTVTTVPGTPYAFKIANIKNLGPGFIANAWVSKTVANTVYIPFQSVGTYKIWGTGTYFHDNPPHDAQYQMVINDTLVNGIDTTTCTIHLRH